MRAAAASFDASDASITLLRSIARRTASRKDRASWPYAVAVAASASSFIYIDLLPERGSWFFLPLPLQPQCAVDPKRVWATRGLRTGVGLHRRQLTLLSEAGHEFRDGLDI